MTYNRLTDSNAGGILITELKGCVPVSRHRKLKSVTKSVARQQRVQTAEYLYTILVMESSNNF